ncbi:MAG: M28 family peptidase [Promethearchaeota archaeon]
MDPSTNKLNKHIIDLKSIMTSVKELSSYKNRIAGTDQIKEACLFITGFLEDIQDIETWIDKFPIYTSYPVESEVNILSPIEKSLPSFPNLYSQNTSPEGLDGELIYVERGGKEEYEGVQVKDNIVLADLSYAPPRPEKAWLARDKGAIAIILANWGHPENKIVGRGAIKHVWGPLTLDDINRIPRIPSVNISKKDAGILKLLLNKNKVIVNVKCRVEDKWVMSNQPICRIIPPKREFNEILVIGGHLESWGGTVTDNSTGNAVMLEIAKILSKERKTINREVLMAFWDGHEIGEAAGSGWFVDNYWSELNERGLAYVNFDGFGMIGTSHFISYSSPETWRFLGEVEKDILGKESEKRLPLKIGDNSFIGIGIPYIFTFATYDPKEMEKLGHALFGWWYHSEEDTLDKVDEEILRLQAELHLEYIIRLLNNSIIPWDYEAFATQIINEIKEIKTNYREIPREDRLNTILRKIEFFQNKAEIINSLAKEYSEKTREELSEKEKVVINKLNKMLLSLGRHLNPAFRSATGKYSHDPYGYSILAKPLPRVYRVLEDLTNLDLNSFEYNCLITQLMREFNYLEDAITTTLYLINRF